MSGGVGSEHTGTRHLGNCTEDYREMDGSDAPTFAAL